MTQQIKLTREELYRKIWEKPTTKVAAEFGISDVGLAKICRKMDVPKPPLGYWRRIETGAKIEPASLPKTTTETTEFVFLYVDVLDGSDKFHQEIQAMIDREDLPENQIKIADDLENAHPLVKKTKQFYAQADADSDTLISPPSQKGYLNVSVSPAQVNRAFFIMDAILKAAEKRGYEAVVSSNSWGEETRIIKEGEEITVSLYESVRKVRKELTPEQKKKPPYLLNIPEEYQSEGKLTLKINQRWSAYQKWSDRKNEPLENRLNDVLAGIVAMLESLVFEKRKKEAEERRRQELIRRREEEKRKREQLESDVDGWSKSEQMRDYLEAYEARLIKEKGAVVPGSPEADWLEWAREYAADLDPLNKIFSNNDE